MDGRKDREAERSIDLLGGLGSAPVPEGIVRRAVEQWSRERDRRAGRVRLARGLALSAVSVAAAALLVVRLRPTIEPTGIAVPPNRTVPGRAPSVAQAGPVAKRGFTLVDRRRGPLHQLDASQRCDRTGPTDRVDRARLADVSLEPPNAVVASSADLAYLNAEPLTAEQPGAVSDIRLASLVTVQEEAGIPDLLGLLRSRSGVEVAVPDGVARMQLALDYTDEPLRNVMRQMGKTLDVRWYRSGAGAASRYAAVPAPALPAGSDSGTAGQPAERAPK